MQRIETRTTFCYSQNILEFFGLACWSVSWLEEAVWVCDLGYELCQLLDPKSEESFAWKTANVLVLCSSWIAFEIQFSYVGIIFEIQWPIHLSKKNQFVILFLKQLVVRIILMNIKCLHCHVCTFIFRNLFKIIRFIVSIRDRTETYMCTFLRAIHFLIPLKWLDRECTITCHNQLKIVKV